jgi:2,4-dienoyl-CoA reductase-like NADH-dependent reductase (Old Yellow Enzyme family)
MAWLSQYVSMEPTYTLFSVTLVGIVLTVSFLLHMSEWWISELQVAWSGYLLSLKAKEHYKYSTSQSSVLKSHPNATPLIKKFVPKNLKICRAFKPFKMTNTVTLKNRIIRAAAFGGSTVKDLVDCHREIAKGGVSMTTIAYACVSPDGKTFKHQLLLNEKHDPNIRKKLKAIVKSVHECDCKISIQLVHGGGFADPSVCPNGRTVAPSSVFNPASMNWPKEMTIDDMKRVLNDFVNASLLCQQVGFDAIELHVGHGYLLSQFLCPFTNRRSDSFGGSNCSKSISIANRLKFPLKVLDGIREQCGKNFPILVKFNVHDGFEQGIQIADVITAAKQFEKHGANMLIPSGGFVSRNGLYMLRGNVPLLRMAKAMPGLLKSAATFLLGPLFVPNTVFEEAFFRKEARLVRDNVNIPVCLIGGITSLPLIEGALHEGFQCVQMARAIIRKPNIVNDWKFFFLNSDERNSNGKNPNVNDEEILTSKCSHCNMCVVSTLDPNLGMKCVERMF